MSPCADAFLRHQQARWLRPDAARWVRPDAAKFLKPGTRPDGVYPALAQQRDAFQRTHDRETAEDVARERPVLAALRAELDAVVAELARRRTERKYSEHQPRVPAGNGDESGEWASNSGSGRPRVYIITSNPDSDAIGDGGSGFSLPMGSIDFGDIASEIDKLDLFDIKPKKPRTGGVRLAGKPPTRLPPIVVTREKPKKPGEPSVGHNGGPPLDELPPIPPKLPNTREDRMTFVRAVARAIGFIGRQAPIVSTYLSLLEQLSYLKTQTDMIRTANDPAETYEVLRDRVQQLPKAGYHKHHIVNQHDGNKEKFGNSRIQRSDNLVSVPWLKHIGISRWYQTPNFNEKYAGRSPTDYLRDKSWEEQFEVGLDILREQGIIK